MKAMKKILLYCWIILLAVVFFPITLVIGIYYFVCFIKEYPVYKKSYSRTIKRIKYSHRYFKSDDYKIFESLLSKSVDVDLNQNKKSFSYFVGKNAYRFGQEPLLFEIREDQLLISFDGDPLEPIDNAFKCIPIAEKKKYLLLFEDEQIDYGTNDKLDLTNFDMLIIENSIEGFANRIAQLENQ